jgi:hypothetical protein
MKTRATLRTNFVTFKGLGNYGRLANQLFQVATVLSYSQKHGVDHILPEWKNAWTDGVDLTEVFRGPFNIDPKVSTYETEDYHERSMEYALIPRSRRMNLMGYFQSELYFADYADFIKRMFSPELRIHNEIVEKNLGTFEGRCSIHVRREDYLKYPEIHPFPGISYYEKAVEKMKAEGYHKFLIFSDDIDWCKENFRGEEYNFSEKNEKNYEDLILMSLCSSHIIANSTFSWWSAWLNKNPEKIVIAPQKWFGDKGPHAHDIIPKNWIQI